MAAEATTSAAYDQSVADLLDDPRVEGWGVLLEAQMAVNRKLAADITRETGWPMSWFEVLLRLARSPGHRMRMSDLADAVSFSTGGFTRLADRIEHAGLARREVCASDRRSSFVVLTDLGLVEIRRAVEVHVRGLEEYYFGLLDPQRVAAVDLAMREVRAFHGR